MLFNMLTSTVLIVTNTLPWQLSLYLHTEEPLLDRHSCLALSSSSGVIIRMLAWSLLFQHAPGQSRLPSPCSATIVNSLLFYTIDLLPSSPNIQVFVELFGCFTRGLSALLLWANCQLSYCACSHCAIYLHVVHISHDSFTMHALCVVQWVCKLHCWPGEQSNKMHWCDNELLHPGTGEDLGMRWGGSMASKNKPFAVL